MRRAQGDPRAYVDGLGRQANDLRKKIASPETPAPRRELLRLELVGVMAALERARLPMSARPSKRVKKAALRRMRAALPVVSHTSPVAASTYFVPAASSSST